MTGGSTVLEGLFRGFIRAEGKSGDYFSGEFGRKMGE